jgi:hypothetical protein
MCLSVVALAQDVPLMVTFCLLHPRSTTAFDSALDVAVPSAGYSGNNTLGFSAARTPDERPPFWACAGGETKR